MYIYKITNLINNKIYIGQTVQKNPKMRWYAHLAYARNGVKAHLYDSIRKYGKENFKWEVLQQANDIDELNILETRWADLCRLQGFVLYNNRQTGNNKLHSEKSKQKMKESQRAAHARRRAEGTEGGWKRIDGGAMKGKKLTDEQKQKRREIMAEVNKKTSGGKTWIILNGKRTWVSKEASV